MAGSSLRLSSLSELAQPSRFVARSGEGWKDVAGGRRTQTGLEGRKVVAAVGFGKERWMKV